MNAETCTQILTAIDAANSADPNQEVWEGEAYPRELLYGQRMSQWLHRLRPDADAALQIGARAQHICRWEHPRDTYPMDRKGYLTWRRGLYTFHAERVGEIIREHGESDDVVERVSFLLHKKKLHDDADTQALEDAACLVFLEFHIADFAAKTEHEKMVNIVKKTWGKMSDTGHEHALKLSYPEPVQAVLVEALGNG